MKIEKSSGNIYQDLGFANARELKLKAALVMAISDIIGAQKITLAEAAERMNMPQQKLSLMMRGIFTGISVVKLLECLRSLGQDVNISVTPAKSANALEITVTQ